MPRPVREPVGATSPARTSTCRLELRIVCLLGAASRGTDPNCVGITSETTSYRHRIASAAETFERVKWGNLGQVRRKLRTSDRSCAVSTRSLSSGPRLDQGVASSSITSTSGPGSKVNVAAPGSVFVVIFSNAIRVSFPNRSTTRVASTWPVSTLAVSPRRS